MKNSNSLYRIRKVKNACVAKKKRDRQEEIDRKLRWAGLK